LLAYYIKNFLNQAKFTTPTKLLYSLNIFNNMLAREVSGPRQRLPGA
jgi:hypothetical protein